MVPSLQEISGVLSSPSDCGADRSIFSDPWSAGYSECDSSLIEIDESKEVFNGAVAYGFLLLRFSQSLFFFKFVSRLKLG